MNHYTQYAAEDAVPASLKDAAKLKKLLVAAEGREHGFDLEIIKVGAGARVYLSAENGNSDELPEDFLKLLGAVIAKAGLKHLEIGYACTADRVASGSQGGGSFRIYPDGAMEYPTITWPRG